MPNLCDIVKCTGCMACYNACPKEAVVMQADNEGFLRPKIIKEKCVECSSCERVCPQLKTHDAVVMPEKIVYACWHKNRRILQKSTSGGAFSALAEVVIKEHGIVFGAAFDSNFKVVHKGVVDKVGLEELRGSKYVQSKIGDVFKEIQKSLREGRKVLFSGTPCQVDGLYSFLGKRNEGKLFTVDLVCHGVPSPLVFSRYLEWIAKDFESSPKRIRFRAKNPGWYVFSMEILNENGSVYSMDTYHDPYLRGFLRQYYLRPSCAQCPYANTKRPGDITLGDDWGYKETCFQDRDNDQGISMVMLNNDNGKLLFDMASKKLSVFLRTLENAIKGNQALSKPFEPNKDRQQFWEDFHKLPFNGIVEKYLYSEDIPSWVEERRQTIKANRKKRFFKNIKKKIKLFRHKLAIFLKSLLGERIIEYLMRLFRID